MQYDPTRRSLYHPETADPVADFSAAWETDQICAELSRLCYYRFDESDPAPRRKLEAALAAAGFSAPEYFIAARMGAEALGTSANGTAYVVFRGTQGGNLDDLIADGKTLPVDWPRGGKVHRGFCEAFLSLQRDLGSWLARTSRNRLVVTGHSLGAAMATVMASVQDEAELVTFGSPRVGDAAFVAGLAGQVRRYVDCDDAVTMVPPELLAYVHAGAMLYINRRGVLMGPQREEAVAEDRRMARREYLQAHAWKIWRNVATRRLADHAPINYVSALLGRREPEL